MIKKFIQSLALDKKEHIVLGVIYSVLIVVFAAFDYALIGFVVGTFLNLYKEIWHDLIKGKGKAELKDFIATEIPILITYIAYLI